jgi:hypothetical protein
MAAGPFEPGKKSAPAAKTATLRQQDARMCLISLVLEKQRRNASGVSANLLRAVSFSDYNRLRFHSRTLRVSHRRWTEL